MKILGKNNKKEVYDTVMDELNKAGIIPFEEYSRAAVQCNLKGKVGNCRFIRLWNHWAVICHVPLDVADLIYNTQIGKKDIRAMGDCACRPPEIWSIGGFIDFYSIHSQEALNLFVEFVKKYNL